jgi:preprotein translocase subunit SecD
MVTGEYGQEQLQLRFEKTAAKKFGQITGANIGKQLVAVANGKALIAPNIQQAIMGGSIVINAGITSMILYDKALADFFRRP